MSPPRIELRCGRPSRLAGPIRGDPALIWPDVISAILSATTSTAMISFEQSHGGDSPSASALSGSVVFVQTLAAGDLLETPCYLQLLAGTASPMERY